MIWACFLHFYQPPTQKRYWIDRVTDESYRRIVKSLLENPQAKITLNVNSILCELWEEFGHHDVLTGLKILVGRGQVELTGSAKFHPLLPKLPEEMIIRQIVLNEVTLNKYFGVVGPFMRNKKLIIDNGKSQGNSPILNSQFSIVRGFFPPEMAYDRRLAKIVASLGYEWIIAEELSLGKPVDYGRIYTVRGVNMADSAPEPASEASPQGETLRKSEMIIFFRDRGFSYKVLAGYLGTEKLFLDELRNRFPDSISNADSRSLPRAQHDSGSQFDRYLLTAMDGETFGHHRPGMEKLLFELFKIPAIRMVHLSDLPQLFEGRESVGTKASTWALMEHEVEKNLPFSRWDDPENDVHKLQWQLTDLAVNTVKNSKHQVPKNKQIPSTKYQKTNKESILNSEVLNLFGIWDLGFGISDMNEVEKLEISDDQKNALKAELLLDRALHSDQYWWACAKPWWSIEYIESGAKELLAAVRATGNDEAAGAAQKLYYQILETAFEYQRSGKVDEISRREDETIRMRTDQTLPKMPKEELLKIIETIKKEMLTVAASQEYERAAQLRDRIRELESYLNPKL